MLQGLRSTIYHVNDIKEAKKWYQNVFGIEPYFDEEFYVGYNIGGYELGLHPDGTEYSEGNHAITYWGVADIHSAFANLIKLGVTIHAQPVDVGGGILMGSIADPFGNVIGLIENPNFKTT
ncbi:MAG: VOC family protein [Flavobacteriaceae bacterium]|nr:VOC family protein [Flavobacteriaceae bacterium]